MIKESTLAAVAVSVVCDRCGQTCPSDDGHPQHAVLSAAWKSGSQQNPEAYELHLCESCFFATLSTIKRERWAQLMFSEEADSLLSDANFGRSDGA